MNKEKMKDMKVLFVLTSHDKLGDTGEKTGFWIEEFAAPYYNLLDKGVDVTVATPKGGKAPIDPNSEGEDAQTEDTKRYYKDEAAQKVINNTVKLETLNAEDFDAVFYPGGHGPLWDLAEDKTSISLIEAFNKLQRPLLIAGSGRDRERLESLANSNIHFLGYVPDSELPDLLARCRAFMWPGEEDFGISPIQAMASGRPVIAYAAGGALETVIPGYTGILFQEQTAEGIIEAVETLDHTPIDTKALREFAQQFDTEQFKRKILQFIEQKWEEKRNRACLDK